MSLTKRLAEAIALDYLKGGMLSEGDRLPSVRDLAARYSASLSTVSQALGSLELEGLLERRQGSGTYKRDPQKAPMHFRHGLVTFIIPTHDQVELVMRIYQGTQDACQRLGLDARILTGDLTMSTEHRLVRESIRRGCHAVVLFPVTRHLHELQNDYLATEEFKVPLVLVDMAYPEQRHIQVLFDNQRAGYEMTRELLRRGHRRIAFMRTESGAGRLMHRSNQLRYAGYLDALEEAGIRHDPADVLTVGLVEDQAAWLVDAERLLREWRAAGRNRPTALIALEDGWAHAVCTEVRALGMRVPEDLELAGFDNLTIAAHIRPRYLTTTPDLRRAGVLAVELAHAAISGELSQPYSYVLPVPVVERVFEGDNPVIRPLDA